MKFILLSLLIPLHSFAVAAHDVPGHTECEERLEGNKAMRNLLQELVQKAPDEVVTYHIFMRVQRLTAAYLKQLPEKEKWLEKFGVSFNFHEVRASSAAALIADFELSGSVRNVVQAVMELTSSEVQQRFDLYPFSYSLPLEASSPSPPPLSHLGKALATPVENLNLSTRTALVLKRAGFNYAGEIVAHSKDQIARAPYVGEKITEIEGALNQLQLDFGMKVPGWPFAEHLPAGRPNKYMSKEDLMRVTIESMEFSDYTAPYLRRAKIYMLGDLVTRTEAELLSLPEFDQRDLYEISERLSQLGLFLGMDVPGWPYPGLAANRSGLLDGPALERAARIKVAAVRSFPTRARTVFPVYGKAYLGDLLTSTRAELRRTPNVGRKTISEVESVLREMRLEIGMEVPGWPYPDLEPQN